MANTIASYYTDLQRTLLSYRLKKQALLHPAAEDPYNKTPPRYIPNYRQETSDTQADSTQTARDIGNLTGGKTRLNLVSALTTNDRVDFYRFKLTNSGNVAMSITTDKGVHVQLLTKAGRVIADSEATSGEKMDNFQALGTGKFSMESGDYYIKVTRPTGMPLSTKPNYALQLSMGKYFEKDYDTVETPAARQSAYSVTAANGSALNQVLNTLGIGNFFDFNA
jgi:hypothetical protein